MKTIVIFCLSACLLTCNSTIACSKDGHDALLAAQESSEKVGNAKKVYHFVTNRVISNKMVSLLNMVHPMREVTKADNYFIMYETLPEKKRKECIELLTKTYGARFTEIENEVITYEQFFMRAYELAESRKKQITRLSFFSPTEKQLADPDRLTSQRIAYKDSKGEERMIERFETSPSKCNADMAGYIKDYLATLQFLITITSEITELTDKVSALQ